MDITKRDAALIKERDTKHTPFNVLGQKYKKRDGSPMTTSRAHQIYQQKRDGFYNRLPNSGKPTRRIRRVVLTKGQVAEKLHIPESKLELRV